MSSYKKTIAITVSTPDKRSQVIKRIYTNLTKEPEVQFTIVQDQVNRIRVYHNVGPGIKILIRTYVVIVIPVLVNLKPLNDLYGVVEFHLDETINTLQFLIDKLRKSQGRRVISERKTQNLEAALTDMMGDF